MNGKIIKGIGGLYCVATPAGDIFAKPRGIFRKNSVKPMIGDNVVLSKDSEETSDYVISEILTRKNSLVRPAVANVDCALFIIAAANPKPDLLLLDKLMAVSVSKGIKTMLVINKADRDGEAAEDIKNQYKNCVDCGVFAVSMTGDNSAEEAETVKNALPEGVTVLSGQSGVGKSTLTNRLLSKQAMTTGELTKKIERGKHTTRHSEMFEIGNGRFLIDSPGFSLFDAMDFGSRELAGFYPEMRPEGASCRFQDCSHTGEPGCFVEELLRDGTVSAGRYERYLKIYAELKEQERNRYK